MKRKDQKKKIRMFLVSLCIYSCFCMAACGADEDSLFREADGMPAERSTEISSEETSSEGIYTTTEGTQTITPATEEDLAKEQKIVVHVCGAVRAPGVYELEADSRIMDAVEAAGGFIDDADMEYVNLATILADGNKVRIPTKDEVTQMSQQEPAQNDMGVITAQDTGITGNTGDSSDAFSSLVNINTADEALLCTLPGIGSTRAQSIINYRMQHGSFSRIEDIMQVSGIKESSFQKIKEYITVK